MLVAVTAILCACTVMIAWLPNHTTLCYVYRPLMVPQLVHIPPVVSVVTLLVAICIFWGYITVPVTLCIHTGLTVLSLSQLLVLCCLHIGASPHHVYECLLHSVAFRYTARATYLQCLHSAAVCHLTVTLKAHSSGNSLQGCVCACLRAINRMDRRHVRLASPSM